MHAAVLLTTFPKARNIKSKNQRNHRVQNSAMRRHQNFFAFVFQRFQLEIEKIPHTRKHLRIRLASARNVFFRIFKRGADVVIDKPGFEKRRTFILSEAYLTNSLVSNRRPARHGTHNLRRMQSAPVRTGVDAVELQSGATEALRHRLSLLYALVIKIDFDIGSLYPVLGVPFCTPVSEKIYLHRG